MSDDIEQPDLFPPIAAETGLGAATLSTRTDERRALIAELPKRQEGGESDRQIATATGASHPHVAKIRREMEARGELQPVATRTDAKGRQQPARKARARPNRQASEPDPAIPALGVETDVEAPDPQTGAADHRPVGHRPAAGHRQAGLLLGLPKLINDRLDAIDVETALRGLDKAAKRDLKSDLPLCLDRLRVVANAVRQTAPPNGPPPEIAWKGSAYGGYVGTTKRGTYYVILTPGQCPPTRPYRVSGYLVAKLDLAKLEHHNRGLNPKGRQGYRDPFDHRDALADPRRKQCQQLWLNGTERELGEPETLEEAKALVEADHRAQAR